MDYKNDNLWLMKGDCLERMKEIKDGSVDLILTDPPYGTTACKWDVVIPLEPMWIELKRVIKPTGAIVLFGSQPFSSVLITSNLKMFKYEWIWHKSKCGSAFTSKYRPQQKHENVIVFGKGTIKYNPQLIEGIPYKRTRAANKGNKLNNHGFGVVSESVTINDGFRYPSTVQFFQQKWRRQDQIHPTQKPVALLEYLIKTYTNENEIVLDFTMGSGSTAIACLNINRNFVGIEKYDKYFEVAKERILNHKPEVNLDKVFQ